MTSIPESLRNLISTHRLSFAPADSPLNQCSYDELLEYFDHVEDTMHLTITPDRILQEAELISSVMSRSDWTSEDIRATHIVDLAEMFAVAGCLQGSYTKTVAKLAREVFYALGRKCRAPQVMGRFRRVLSEGVATSFLEIIKSDLSCFVDSNGVSSMHPDVDERRERLVNHAAFIGDLYAERLLPDLIYTSLVMELLDRLENVLHCRMLHIILAKGQYSTGGAQGVNYFMNLIDSRLQRLIETTPFTKEVNPFLWRWIVAVGNVVIRTLDWYKLSAEDQEEEIELAGCHDLAIPAGNCLLLALLEGHYSPGIDFAWFSGRTKNYACVARPENSI
ncbi:hypothetical protein GLOTRDRAFT_94676 [Gloeophyllum trabeum ATCC 11539]|uniref:Uncharacterized protein n=1 Tax=Gloeophyllum trabeum (strain ATCC 11539 / FP-39264 / Madison 617) TaxID=670483 RepID=S7Q0X1_GLOTA|nr:uncharacterized protein GLOTRDRAFT_94676 [Gloeophyllum trabeum ATCC 11539]EPQ53413.1 hypothetical protein GLOTRDRAFT_94676 [Gloeophyllum trabeum ATCC 11539]